MINSLKDLETNSISYLNRQVFLYTLTLLDLGVSFVYLFSWSVESGI